MIQKTKWFVSDFVINELDPGSFSWEINYDKGDLVDSEEEAKLLLTAKKLNATYEMLKSGSPIFDSQELGVNYFKNMITNRPNEMLGINYVMNVLLFSHFGPLGGIRKVEVEE